MTWNSFSAGCRSGNVRLGVSLLLCILACPTAALALTQGELDASRNVWNANGSDDYDYFMQRDCFCFEDYIRPGLVEVRAGAISAVTDADTLQPLDPQFFLTVDELFDVLQSAIDAPAFEIQAQFDNTLGYPTSIFIDEVENIADEEVAYVARDLTLVPEPTSLVLAILATMGIAYGRVAERMARR
jgi:hypothetical protein